MKELETGKDKIKKICDILQNETLAPARKEADRLIQEAESQARAIIKNAETKASELIKQAATKIANEKALLDKQIVAALSQAKELLRQEIQERLFNEGLSDWLDKESVDPKLAANIISALVQAVEKEGLGVNFAAEVGRMASVEKVNASLVDGILKKLQDKTVVVGDFAGGAQLKLLDRRLTLDMSDRALKELLGSLVRKSFRDLLFQES